MTSSKEDHDLLMKLSNDMTWVKRIMGLLVLPVIGACVKFLMAGLTWPGS